jgi:Tfp pilus assembly protein FimT
MFVFNGLKQKLIRSKLGVSVLELLLYIVIAAALVLAAWFGLNSLMDRGNESAVKQSLASAYKISKAVCVYQADWDTCKVTDDFDPSVTSAAAGEDTIQAALAAEGLTVTATLSGSQLTLSNTVNGYSDTLVLANYYSPPIQ